MINLSQLKGDTLFSILVIRSKKKKAKGFFLGKKNKDHTTIFYQMPNRDMIEEKEYFINNKELKDISEQSIILLQKDIPNTPYMVREGFVREGFVREADMYCRIEFTHIGIVVRFDYDKKEAVLKQGTLF